MAKARNQNSRTKEPQPRGVFSSEDLLRLGHLCQQAAAFLLAVLLLWCILVPCDATSVFIGSSLPQTMLALFTGLLAAAGVALTGSAPRISGRETVIALTALVWLIAVTLIAGDGVNPRTAWLGCWHVIGLGGIYYTSRLVIFGSNARGLVITILISGSMALSLQAVYQVAVDFPADRAEYLADPEGMLKRNGVDAPAGSPARKRFEDRFLESREPIATFALANSLAVFLSGGLVLLAGCLVSSASAVDRWRIALALAASLAIFAAWFLTKSRTAYVGIFCGLVYWLVLAKFANTSPQLIRRLRAAMLAAGVLSVVAFVWFMKNDSLVLSEAFYSLRFRFEYWYATAQMIFQHGATGIGLGNFQAYYPAYKLELASETIADPHNWVLDMAVSLSFPFTLVVCSWLGCYLLPSSSNEQLQDGDDISSKSLHPPVLLGCVVGGGLLLFGLFVFRQIDMESFLIAWPIACVSGFCVHPLSKRVAVQPRVVLQATLVTISVCLLASGSWQASGLAIPFVVLVGALAETDAIRQPAARRAWIPVLVAAFGLVVFCLQTWLPVTRVWNLKAELPLARNAPQQQQLIDRAIAADPLDAQLLSLRGQVLAIQAAEGTKLTFERNANETREQFEQWLAADGVSSGNWKLAGSVMLDLAESAAGFDLPLEPWLSEAARCFGGAVERYPSDVGLRVQLATCYVLTNDINGADRELAEAWRISQATPHDDKRLNMQEIYLPAGVLSPEARQQFQPLSGGRVKAELAASWVRNKVGNDGN